MTRRLTARSLVGVLVALLVTAAVTAPGTAQADPASKPAAAGAGDRAAGTAARVPVVSAALVFASVVESYAGYQPQTRCRPTPKPGVLMLAEALAARGGGVGPIGRSCAGSSTSEHKEARAFDWMLDARNPDDRALAKTFLAEVMAPDVLGNEHALARRMGIMYVIWNDRIYASYDGFSRRPYLSSGCRTKKRCSPTLRHRDHMHISLTRQAARGLTSWYLEQPPA